jgi:hypothetical protein
LISDSARFAANEAASIRSARDWRGLYESPPGPSM